ncbi:MAG: DnaD domain protein [Clostridiales Family XIII bacterium]|jgi:DnaD/phage-associated family protein|nr:DnaD domain protein [Clostridiales Family XIII bacterium]
MGFSAEAPRDPRLEDTAISNIFLLDILPDVPDGAYVSVYVYALMSLRQGVYLTHSELATRLSLPVEKVLAAWRYFEKRRIIRRVPKTPGDETQFDVEFVDLRGLLYAKADAPSGGAQEAARTALSDAALRKLGADVAALTGNPSFGAGDMMQIKKWLTEWGATPEAVLCAYRYALETKGVTRANYVAKIVREWTDKGVRTEADAAAWLAEADARHGFHKEMMEALGLPFKAVTEAERKVFDRWTDEYGYTPAELLEKARTKTAGAGNALKYLEGILKKEREKAAGGGAGDGAGSGGRLSARAEYYRGVQEKNRREAEAHRAEVYKAVPEIQTLDDEMVALNMEKIRLVTSSARDKKRAWDRLEADLAAKAAKRKALLAGAGFAEDYTDVHYDCKRCEDTGLVLGSGASCECYGKI